MELFYRVYQQIYRSASYFQKWTIPVILEGARVYDSIISILNQKQTTLIITDENIIKLNLMGDLLGALDKANYKYVIYDKVKSNPSIENVQEAVKIYQNEGCHSIIAFGGGSPIDCAKIVAARIVKPEKAVEEMKGLLKIRKRLVPVIAIPTTAGTGSEATIAAVISDEKTHEKYVISDMCLIPPYAAFIPELTQTLPPSITATTGLDALTHAIEAYIGKSNTKQTQKDALEAIKLIYDNLLEVYTNGDNLEARKAMQYASFYAGKAFTRAYVGNVHAISHALGGLYNVPHGLGNSVVLPVVLRQYGEAIDIKLARISDYIGLSKGMDTTKEKALAVLSWIEELNMKMAIPKTIPEIKNADIDILAKRACNEANPFYPVPVIWSEEKFKHIFIQLKGESYEGC